LSHNTYLSFTQICDPATEIMVQIKLPITWL